MCVSLAEPGWNPEPALRMNFPKLFEAVAFGFVSALVLALAAWALRFSFALPDETDGWAIFLWGLAWFGMLYRFVHEGDYSLVFNNRATGAQIELCNNVPNEGEFSSFVTALKTVIKNPPPPNPDSSPTTADGILTSAEFEEVKRQPPPLASIGDKP